MKTYCHTDEDLAALAAYMEKSGETTRAADWVVTRLRHVLDRRRRIISKVKQGKLTWPPPKEKSSDGENERMSTLQGAFDELVETMNNRTSTPRELAHDLAHGLHAVAWDVTAEVTGLHPSGNEPVFENELNKSFNALASELIEWINEQRAANPIDIKA